jgi:RNA polymerase sigma-70 factor (ECF subfamily)
MLVVAEHEQLPVREARAGKPEAWELLFKRYQLPLYVYVFELIHREQTSLDIVQETFINAVRHIGGLRQDEKFGSWLFGIAHQKCIQHWRRLDPAHVPLDVEETDYPGLDAGPQELLIRKEEEAEFMKLLDQLPVAHRSVMLLHFVEDFSLDEIARITGAQLGTVKSRMHYARKALRKLMEDHES